MLETLQRDVSKFVRSSSFRHGDALSFQVPLVPGVVNLPGRHSPAAYLDALGVYQAPARVLVVGAGNGGLAVECANRGATQLVAVETRAAFAQALRHIQELFTARWQSSVPARSLTVITQAPYFAEARQFDLILWPEAVDKIKQPPVALKELDSYLAPGGKLFIEVMHGPHGWVPKINSWKPTVDALHQGLSEVFGSSWTRSIPGRAANRTIYLIEKTGATAIEPAKIELLAPSPAPAPEPVVSGPSAPLSPPAESSPPKVASMSELIEGASAQGKGYRCGICDKRGHNARTCPSRKDAAPKVTKDQRRLVDPDDEPTIILDDHEVDLDDE